MNKLFKATTTVPGTKEPFVDWYEASDEAAARELWRQDCERNGLPTTATVILSECDPVTLKPIVP